MQIYLISFKHEANYLKKNSFFMLLNKSIWKYGKLFLLLKFMLAYSLLINLHL